MIYSFGREGSEAPVSWYKRGKKESVDENCSFAACLKQLIASRGIKPSQLAARLHVDDSLVRKWLAGSRVPPLKANYIDRIGVYLGLSPEEQLRLKKSQIHSIDATILALPGQPPGEDRADEHKQALVTLLQAIPEAAFLLDAAGRVVAANDTAARRLGAPGSAPAGLEPFLHLAPEVARNISRVFASGHSRRFKDTRDFRDFLYSLYPVKNGKGAVTGVAVLAMDITGFESISPRTKGSDE